jgi:protein SCO1/2
MIAGALLQLSSVAQAVQAQAQARDGTGALPDHSLYRLTGRWTNHDGRSLALAELRGETVVLAMVYTSCTMTCPLITREMQSVQRALPPDVRARVRFVLASFDPARDSVGALRRHVEKMALDARWLALRGAPPDVRQLAVLLSVSYVSCQAGTSTIRTSSACSTRRVLRFQSPRVPGDREAPGQGRRWQHGRLLRPLAILIIASFVRALHACHSHVALRDRVQPAGGMCVASPGQAQPAPRVAPPFENLRFRENWAEAPSGDPLDPLKHMTLSDGGGAWLSLGGHLRVRGESVRHFLGGGTGTRTDAFLAVRAHLHADLHLGTHLRGFVEGRVADVAGRELPGGARPLDRNRGDLGNAFVELRHAERRAPQRGSAVRVIGARTHHLAARLGNVRQVFEGNVEVRRRWRSAPSRFVRSCCARLGATSPTTSRASGHDGRLAAGARWARVGKRGVGEVGARGGSDSAGKTGHRDDAASSRPSRS